MTPEELDAIEAMANAATPGPWEVHDGGRRDYTVCHMTGEDTCGPLFVRDGVHDDCRDGDFGGIPRN